MLIDINEDINWGALIKMVWDKRKLSDIHDYEWSLSAIVLDIEQIAAAWAQRTCWFHTAIYDHQTANH